MNPSTNIFSEINKLRDNLFEFERNSINVECSKETFDRIIGYIKLVVEIESVFLGNETNIRVNYFNTFLKNLENINNRIYNNFGPSLKKSLASVFHEELKKIIEDAIQDDSDLNALFLNLEFNFNFFKKLNFLSQNLIAVGANGSGKSSLAEHLKITLSDNGLIISAQKLLFIPQFTSISSHNDTQIKLKTFQNKYIDLKVPYSIDSFSEINTAITDIGKQFHILLDNLLAERNFIRNEYLDVLEKNPSTKVEIPKSKLDVAITIWNDLIKHRHLECDNVNIYLKLDSNLERRYPAYRMSDGEKVALYLISYILQAPKNGFIIIDEPEMYLHKTVLNKLWNKLELLRNDCIFMYLTHDLDFVSRRQNCKKVWIKSYKHPITWEMEEIPNNDNLPEDLVMELLGSRNDIIFCEGKKGGIDERVYNIIFPNFNIKPVNSCHDVINYTKSFNALEIATTKAFGLIDSDHTPKDRLDSLKNDKIYPLQSAEIENLFLDEDFIRLIAEKLIISNIEAAIKAIKNDVINDLIKQKEIQTSNYITSKINYYFKESHVSKGNTIIEVKNNFTTFVSNIKIDSDYQKRLEHLESIINQKDYKSAILVFNNKGIKSIINKHLNISNYTERAIILLTNSNQAQDIIRKYFHHDLLHLNNHL